MTLPDKTYLLHNTNLGDHVTSYCMMALLGKRHHQRYRLSMIDGWGTDRTTRLREIEDFYTCVENNYPPILVTEPPETKIEPWLNWCYPPLPSQYVWKIEKTDPIYCYQFDGASSPELSNPSRELIVQIREYLRSYGINGIRLGKHLSLSEIGAYLKRCSLFIGADSGMSHLAHSVGCPVYIYEGGLPVVAAHKNKNMNVFKSFGDFKMRAEHWLQFLSL